MYKYFIRFLGKPNRRACKILSPVRLCMAILLISTLQISSAVAQKLSYVKKNTTIAAIFSAIKKQTGYHVVWNESKLNASKQINASFNKAPLTEVMNVVLKETGLIYSIDNKVIVISEKEPPLSDKDKATMQNNLGTHTGFKFDIRGQVSDEHNKSLPGALIRLKHTNLITRSNNNGEFVLKNVPENAVLIISYIGYESKEIPASGNLMTIQLVPASGKLDEVEINAGYYSVKQRELTGAIAKIDAKTIERQPVNNPLQALQNRVAGLEITQLTGVPGGGFKVQIRGRNSISNGNGPLYIVDGIPFPSGRINTANSIILGEASPLSTIQPNDIEGIEVLKDADATAIYGSRGANGVILITTKKGKTGLTKVEAGTAHGLARVGHRLGLLNTSQYLAMRKEALQNNGANPTAADLDLTTWDQTRYTDWQEKMIGGAAYVSNSSLKVSGGTGSSNYLLSGTYYREGTVFPGSFGFNRGGLLANINFGTADSRLNAGFTASYTHAVNKLPTAEPTMDILRSPNAPEPFNEYGQLNWYHNNVPVVTNPMATLLNTTDSNTDNLLANINLSYRLAKGLFLKSTFGYMILKSEQLIKSPNAARNPAGNPASVNRQSQFGNVSNHTYIAEPQLTYKLKLGAGEMNALAGMSFQQNVSSYRNILASNFSSDELMENISSASVFSVNESTYTKYKYAALFARINYSLLDKYFVNLTARRDGSSRFGPGKQFANFGAIGAAWIFSKEEWITEHIPFLSFGKIRASYGITGNDQIPDYQYMQLFSGNSSYQGSPSMYINRIANPDFAWETNKKAELALQLGFLKDRVNIQAAYFRNRSANQLLGNALPPSVGAATILANLPATVQNTGLEIEAGIQLLQRKDWSWTTNFNFTLPGNKLLKYPNLATSTNANNYIIGQPLDIRRYYNTYVDPQSGLYVAEDKDGNGQRNDADRYLHQFIGQLFYGGWQNSIRYKQLNLDFLISFVKQNGNSLYYGMSISPGFFQNSLPLSNQPLAALNRWQQQSSIGEIPKYNSNIAGFTNFGIGAREGRQSVADDSFARLKNVSLNYRLPQKWFSTIRISSAEIYLQGQNLLTITRYDGLDPESPAGTNLKLPPLQMFTIGLRATL